MREKYNCFLIDKDLPDYFEKLTDFPFSKKLKILEKLYNTYGRDILVKSLFIYKEEYIDKGRYNYLYIENVLKSICNKYKESEIE